jgi:hypothetical protein
LNSRPSASRTIYLIQLLFSSCELVGIVVQYREEGSGRPIYHRDRVDPIHQSAPEGEKGKGETGKRGKVEKGKGEKGNKGKGFTGKVVVNQFQYFEKWLQ